jgi:hypothetical protein
MLVASYGQLLVPTTWAEQHHFLAGFIFSPCVALFALGVIVLSEGIVQKVGGVSLMSLARGSKAKLVRFLVVAAVTGIFIEAYARLGNLWYYAYYPTWFYWPALVPSFILYWVMIVESYMAGKALLDRVISFGGRPSKDGALRYYPWEPGFYILLGTVGAMLFVGGTLGAVLWYFVTGGYTFNPYQLVSSAAPLHYIMMAFAGLWFICESIMYGRQRPSLLHSLLHGYVVPALALLGAAAVLSLVWESQNVPVGYWVYTNWPWPDLTVFGVQLSVVAAWPANYIVYLMVPCVLVGAWGAVFWTRPDRRPQVKELHNNGGK